MISRSGLTLVSTPLAPLVTLLKNFLNVTFIANQVISTRLIEMVFLVALYQSVYIDLLRADWSDSLRGTPQISILSQSQTLMY